MVVHEPEAPIKKSTPVVDLQFHMRTAGFRSRSRLLTETRLVNNSLTDQGTLEDRREAQNLMEPLEISETDEVGRATATYIISSSTGKALARVDTVPAVSKLPLTQRLLGIFLPNGYPHTVSSDYTPYQIYDSFQAFFSAIAGLLASRAVLQGLGVGDENATATAAMLLSIAQESLGRFATIFFAHWASRRIESDCKFYRLLADIVNDCAFVMDCLSPSLSKPVRIPLLCAASMCRAICGVAGGSSKAILSAHFARAHNIGELNAKDSSQETVISLLGIWAGGLVVSRVDGITATWAWLLCLLALHLTTNYMAVCSVSMTTLNRQRSSIVFSNLSSDDGTWRSVTPQEVTEQERIFTIDGALTWKGNHVGFCKFGTLQDVLEHLGGTISTYTSSATDIAIPLTRLLETFQGSGYLLWFDPPRRRAIIVLKSEATAQTEIVAWWHAIKIAKAFAAGEYSKHTEPSGVLQALENTLSSDVLQQKLMETLQKAGWNTTISLLQTSPSRRIRLKHVAVAQVFKQSRLG